ncbi:MAG: VOC family protein [Myxococcota bacterium]|nr:VOC family protein [Myxococcota bacterium]
MLTPYVQLTTITSLIRVAPAEMLGGVFIRYVLRTTDLESARTFYADAIGLALPSGSSAESALEAWPLHERARANGAPAHWLGQLAVDDVESAVARLVERGSTRLGPTVDASDHVRFATLRDPSGAVIAIRSGAAPASDRPVAWHQLHTSDLDTAWKLYSELFGWTHLDTIDVPDPPGGHRVFSWAAGGTPVGSMANTARWPGVHPHWAFYLHLPVADIESATARVRAQGGTAMDVIALPNGTRLAPCEDPQGAAFGLVGPAARRDSRD